MQAPADQLPDSVQVHADRWRIQEFLDEVTNPCVWGKNLIWQNFFRNCINIKEIGLTGDLASLVPPSPSLGPANTDVHVYPSRMFVYISMKHDGIWTDIPLQLVMYCFPVQTFQRIVFFVCFFLNFGGHKSFLWGHWYPCFWLLVTFLGFKAWVSILICTWWRRACYTFLETFQRSWKSTKSKCFF